jgi:hypothetical protein
VVEVALRESSLKIGSALRAPSLMMDVASRDESPVVDASLQAVVESALSVESETFVAAP